MHGCGRSSTFTTLDPRCCCVACDTGTGNDDKYLIADLALSKSPADMSLMAGQQRRWNKACI